MPSPEIGPLFGRTLRRRWLPILAAWSLGSIAVLGATIALSRPAYRAVSLLRVDPATDGLFGIRTQGDGHQDFVETQVRLLTSPKVLNAAASSHEAFGLPRIRESRDVVEDLRSAVKVNVIPGTYLIEVAMTSRDPREAATLANALVETFLKASNEWSDGMTRTQIKNLEGYQADLEDQLVELERRRKEVVSRGDVGIEQPATNRAGISIEEYKNVRQELSANNMELAEAQAWLTAAKAALNKAGKDPAPSAVEDRIYRQIERRFKLDPEVVNFAEQMNLARQKLEEVRRNAPQPGDPAERAAERKWNSLKARYNDLWDAKSLAIREQIELGVGREMDPEQEVREAEAKVRQLQSRQKSLARLGKDLEVGNLRQAADPVEVTMLLDQRNSLKEMSGKIFRRLEQLRFEARSGARVRVVDEARPPGKPVGRETPHPLILGLIPLAMLIPAFGLFAGVEAWSGPRARRDRGKPRSAGPRAEV